MKHMLKRNNSADSDSPIHLIDALGQLQNVKNKIDKKLVNECSCSLMIPSIPLSRLRLPLRFRFRRNFGSMGFW